MRRCREPGASARSIVTALPRRAVTDEALQARYDAEAEGQSAAGGGARRAISW